MEKVVLNLFSSAQISTECLSSLCIVEKVSKQIHFPFTEACRSRTAVYGTCYIAHKKYSILWVGVSKVAVMQKEQ